MKEHKLNINGGTMKLSILTIVLLFLLTMPLIAATSTFNETTISMKIIPNVTSPVNEAILKIELRNAITSQNNQDFTVKIVKGTDISGKWAWKVVMDDGTTASSKTVNYDFGYVSEGDSVTLNASDALSLKKCFNELTTCKSSVNGYSNSFNVCNNLIGNQSRLNSKLNNCNATLLQNNVDLATKDKKIEEIQAESDATKNSKWMFGIGGLIAGILGLLFYQGKLGNSSKEKSMGEFNKGQAG